MKRERESGIRVYNVEPGLVVRVGPLQQTGGHGDGPFDETPLTFSCTGLYTKDPNALPLDRAPEKLKKEISRCPGNLPSCESRVNDRFPL